MSQKNYNPEIWTSNESTVSKKELIEKTLIESSINKRATKEAKTIKPNKFIPVIILGFVLFFVGIFTESMILISIAATLIFGLGLGGIMFSLVFNSLNKKRIKRKIRAELTDEKILFKKSILSIVENYSISLILCIISFLSIFLIGIPLILFEEYISINIETVLYILIFSSVFFGVICKPIEAGIKKKRKERLTQEEEEI